jgi:NAD(P)H-dependent FMN reductase
MVTIKLLLASTRPGRFGEKPARWLYDLAQQRGDAQYELIDLQTVNLPFLDEPNVPAAHQYTKDHTKQWSATIESGDGFVFITPEYNFHPPASLINAVDFLWQEWNYKPVSFLSYGTVGGARSIEHLHAFVTPFKMYALREDVRIEDPKQFTNEQGVFTPSEAHGKAAHSMLDQLVFWAGQMQRGRSEMKKP